MKTDPSDPSCLLLSDIVVQCERRKNHGHRTAQTGTPLSETCCNGRVRVCAITGDRQTCAKMAHLGVLPGSELEMLCKGGGKQCMIKINGGTISLDAFTAANILVAPV